MGEFHTYFVGCDEWGLAVWAHNADNIAYSNGQYLLIDAHGNVVAQNANLARITQQATELGIDFAKTGNGNPKLGEQLHLFNRPTPGDLAIVGAKPRLAERLLREDVVTYENVGKHDPNHPNHDKSASTLPPNHIQLFKQARPYFTAESSEAQKGVLYALEIRDGRVVAIHRFQGQNGAYHWNGSTNSTDSNGNPRRINAPVDLRRQIGRQA